MGPFGISKPLQEAELRGLTAYAWSAEASALGCHLEGAGSCRVQGLGLGVYGFRGLGFRV